MGLGIGVRLGLVLGGVGDAGWQVVRTALGLLQRVAEGAAGRTPSCWEGVGGRGEGLGVRG